MDRFVCRDILKNRTFVEKKERKRVIVFHSI